MPAAVPQSGDLAIDTGGYMVATNVGLDGEVIWLDWNSYVPVALNLIGSSLGPNSQLISNADHGVNAMELKNSALQGSLFSGSGNLEMDIDQNAAVVNYGWLGVAASTGHAGTLVKALGDFANIGTIVAGQNGAFTLFQGTPPVRAQMFGNTGTIEVDPGGRVSVYSEQSGTIYNSLVFNQNLITANAGTLVISDNVAQTPGGTIDIANGGVFELNGTLDGGTVVIDDSSLNFGQTGAIGFLSISGAATTLDLIGNSDTLAFANPVTAGFDVATNTLNVYGSGSTTQPIDSFHLGGATAYSAADFTASGTTVVFMAHPGS